MREVAPEIVGLRARVRAFALRPRGPLGFRLRVADDDFAYFVSESLSRYVAAPVKAAARK